MRPASPKHTCLLATIVGLLAASAPPPAGAEEVTQEDIDALERDLGRAQGERRDPLLTMLLEGLVARCYPETTGEANPVVRDDFSSRCLTRAVEVAEEIMAVDGHDHRDQALFVAGKSSIALRRPAQGKALLEQYLAEFPGGSEVPLAHYALADLAHEDKQYDEAITHYRAAAEAVSGSAGAHLRYRLAWCLHEAGRTAEGAQVLVDLIGMVEGPYEAARQTARGDLAVLLTEAADAELTLRLAGAAGAPQAPSLAGSVAAALMTAKKHDVAAAHYAAMVARWGDHIEAPTWQVACVDAAEASGDMFTMAASTLALMEGFGPASRYAVTHGSASAYRAQALKVEEVSRSTVGKLHQRHTASGSPDAAAIEALYQAYLESFPEASKRAEMRLALAALYQGDGRVNEALDEMLVVVEQEAGRERGTQAAAIAMELIAAHLPDPRAPGPLTAVEQRLVRLAELFSDGYARHADGARYLAAAGQVLSDRGEHEHARKLLVAVTTRFPSSAEARLAAAEAAQTVLATGDWAATAALVDELLANRQLAAAHPDLAEVLARTRSTARFNEAEALSAAGDPAGAAALYEKLATEDPVGELAPSALLNAAICRGETGDSTRAAMMFRRVYSNYPDDELAPAAMEQEAYLKWERQDFTGAARLYRLLADDHPDADKAAWALYTSAALYDQEGLFDEAIDGYGQLLERFPAAPECAEARPRLAELTAE